MDETGADVGVFRFGQMQHIVHNAVADIGSGGIGNAGRNLIVLQMSHDGFYRNGRKIGGFALFHQLGIQRLFAVIVRYSGFG
ncbi:hypothetical protein SDC9_152931 [bioreactor metagenome]|uniref:Uncharacterized protein n=1 Tax=bioreactor metagenome TaxID=1076179 RepID=A0A645EW66_9ZZZZ